MTMAPSVSQSSHKPRRRRKDEDGTLTGPNNGSVNFDATTNTQKPGFPLVAFLWPARRRVSQWVLLPLILMAVGLFRWATAMWRYSGSWFAW